MIPVPEIVLVLVVSSILLGARALWGVNPVPSAPRAADFRRSAQTGAITERTRVRLVASCVMFAVISVPLIIGVVPPNGIYGFRTAATQSSPAIWYPANAFMGWALLAAAALSATLLIALPRTARRWLLWLTFLVPVSGAIAASFVYLQRLVI